MKALVYVIEFSARTVDVVSPKSQFMVDESIYCKPGEFDHLEGFDGLKAEGGMLDYYLFRWKGSQFDTIAKELLINNF